MAPFTFSELYKLLTNSLCCKPVVLNLQIPSWAFHARDRLEVLSNGASMELPNCEDTPLVDDFALLIDGQLK